MNNQKGFTIIEVLIGIGFLVIIMAVFLSTAGWMFVKTKDNKQESAAAVLLQNEVEAVYNVLINNFDPLVIASPGVEGADYHIIKNINKWALISGKNVNVEGRYTISDKFYRVCRNTNTGDIISGDINSCGANGGKEDTDSQKVKVEISWSQNGLPKSISGEIIFVNLGI